jgi:ribosomal protein S12 methylthiotransferase accessory factor
MQAEVTFPSPTRIQATSKGLTVEVGPPPDRGGDPNAYGPFDILLCALATCTGFQVADFLRERGFDTSSAGVRIQAERGAESHLLESISIEVVVPSGFPEKYRDAIVRAAGLCFVKHQLGHQPEIITTVIEA